VRRSAKKEAAQEMIIEEQQFPEETLRTSFVSNAQTLIESPREERIESLPCLLKLFTIERLCLYQRF